MIIIEIAYGSVYPTIEVTYDTTQVDVVSGFDASPVTIELDYASITIADLDKKVPYVGATEDVDLGEFGLTAGFLQVDTTPTNTPEEQGTMYWDGDAETVALIMNGTIQKIGEDVFFHVQNKTGSPIPKGSCVRFDGTDGNSGKLLIARFIADGTYPSQYFMGVTAEAIGNGQFGKVYHFGKMRGINLSAYQDGDILYASTTVAGGFQTAVPVAPNNIIIVAAVVSAKNNGVLMIRSTLGSNINNDEGVKIINPMNGDILAYNSTSGLWENISAGGGITTLNGLTPAVQTFATGSSGTDFNISSATATHTFNIPTASATNRGLLSSSDWSLFNAKQDNNLYTADGTLTGNRAVTMGSYTLTFEKDILVHGLTVGRGEGDFYENSAFGGQALVNNNTGINIAAFGSNALYSNTNGNSNTAIGYQSMYDNTSGSENTAIGVLSLNNNTSGNENAAIGGYALAENTTGYNNSALGMYAGRSAGALFENNQTSNNSVYLGYNTRAGASGSNNEIVIGASALGNGSNTVTLGNNSIVNTYLKGVLNVSTINAATTDTDKFLVSDSGVVKFRTGAELLSDIGGQPAGSYVVTTRTLTINGTSYDLSADRSWSVGTVTSVDISVPTGLTVSGNPITSAGTLAIALASGYVIPTQTTLDGKVPYTGATANVNLGAFDLSADVISGNTGSFTSNGSSDTFAITHSSGSGKALNISKGGNGEGLTVVKTSGSGNAASITGGITLLTTLNLTNALADTYIASSANWNTAYNNRIDALTTTGNSGAATLAANTLNVPEYTLSGLGGVPSTRSITINGTAFDLSADRTYSVGTVTSVAALTLGTTGTDVSSSVANGTTTPVITLNIPTASATNRGALSSADWGTFNAKEPAITAGTSSQYYRGDKTFQTLNTAAVAEQTNLYFTEDRVRGTVLTGLNLASGGTIAATDSVLQAFGKVQNQISALVGGVIYKGTWNASTNTPTLASGTGAKGDYYIVTVDGTTNLDGITDWKVGDWAIFNGTTWDKVDNTDAVSSVNGYTGAVSLVTGDVLEGSGSLPSRPSQLYFTDARARLALSAGTGISYDNTTGVITNASPDQTVALTGGGTTSISGTYPNFTITSNDQFVGTVTSVGTSAPLTGGTITTTGTIGITQSSSVADGYLSSTDWNTFNSKEPAVTKGNLTEATSSVLTITGGTGAVIGTGTTIQVKEASGSVSGFLSSTDWSTFNNKQNALTNPVTGTGTANQIAYFTGTSTIGSLSTTTYPSLTELSYVKGVTSAIQTQLNGKQATLTLTTTGSSGAATLVGATINIPNYTLSGLGGVPTTRTITINGTALDLSADRSFSVGTVTSVAALTIGTTGTDITSTVANGTTTPVITLNIPTASASNRGALSSTDWNTFNGKQNALTNPVTGTGTSGQVAYFNGTSSITSESNLFWDAANDRLGIGTTSPSTALHVVGAGTFITSDTTGTTELLVLSRNASGWGRTSFKQSYNSTYFTNGKTFTLTNDSNTDFAHFAGNNGGTITNLIIPTGNVTATAFIPSGSTVPTNGMYLSAANTLNFSTNSTNRLTISSTGAATFSSSVSATNGIFNGVSTVNLKIQNGSTANTTVLVQSFGTEAAGENASILFKSAANNINTEYAKGLIAFRNNGTGYGRGDIYFATQNGTGSSNALLSDAKMVILAGGNVGIGTTAPDTKLEVKGDEVRISGTTASNGGLQVYKGQLGVTASARLLVADDYADVYQLRVRGISAGNFSSTIYASIDSSGNGYFAGTLGVGVTSPAQKLHVVGDGTAFQRSTADAFGLALDIYKSRGSLASPANVVNGDEILQLRSIPYSNAYKFLNTITTTIDGTFTAGQNPPTRIGFWTNIANGSSVEQMRITSAGGVSITGPYISMDGSGAGSFSSPPSAMGYGLFPHSGVGLGISSVVGMSFWTGTTPVQRMTITSGGAVEMTGSVKTGAPSGGTAKPWKLGNAVSGGAPSTTHYIEIEIDGTMYFLAAGNTAP